MLQHNIVDVGVPPLVLVGLTFLVHVLILYTPHCIVVRFVSNRQLIEANIVHHQVIYEVNPLLVVVLLLLEAHPGPPFTEKASTALRLIFLNLIYLEIYFLHLKSIGHLTMNTP